MTWLSLTVSLRADWRMAGGSSFSTATINGAWSVFSIGKRWITSGHSGPLDLILNDNCRNTREIVSRTQAMTGADVGISAAGTGQMREVIFEATPELRAAAVGRQLEALVDSGVEPTEIMLLSPLTLHESTYGRLPARWRQRIDILNLRGLQRRPRSRFGFATIADFKGLESRFILLADIGMKEQELDLPALYVGMTRARIGLWVFLGESFEGSRQRRLMKGSRVDRERRRGDRQAPGAWNTSSAS